MTSSFVQRWREKVALCPDSVDTKPVNSQSLGGLKVRKIGTSSVVTDRTSKMFAHGALEFS